jgi:branched-chain amino acid transport system ATP-binding protein
VPEGRLIFPYMTVEENLRIGAINRRARPVLAEALDEIYALFPRLAERRRQLGGTLSGGEQQMLALGRGLMAKPRLLMLDEPTLGLAPIMTRLIFETLARLRAAGLTILLAEQDVAQTLALADRAYVLENGRIALEGSGRELLDDPRVKAAYLGL